MNDHAKQEFLNRQGEEIADAVIAAHTPERRKVSLFCDGLLPYVRDAQRRAVSLYEAGNYQQAAVEALASLTIIECWAESRGMR